MCVKKRCVRNQKPGHNFSRPRNVSKNLSHALFPLQPGPLTHFLLFSRPKTFIPISISIGFDTFGYASPSQIDPWPFMVLNLNSIFTVHSLGFVFSSFFLILDNPKINSVTFKMYSSIG